MEESKNRYLEDFEKLLNQEEIQSNNTYKSSDLRHHVISSMNAIQKSDMQVFEEALDEIKERNFDAHSPWIYDDILIFVLTVGCLKFSIASNWVNELCLIRMNNQSDNKRRFTETLHFLLNGSYSGLSYIIVLCCDLSGKLEQLEEKVIVDAYISANRHFESSDDEFSKTISKASIQSVIKLKGLDDLKKREEELEFIEAFEKRSNEVSQIIFWLFFSALIPLAVYLSYVFIISIQTMNEGWQKTFLEYFFSPLISIGSFGFILFKRERVINYIHKKINSFWGCKKV